jgi:hypothetical protein
MTRYALMAEAVGSGQPPYVAWVAKRGSAFPLTCSLTNARWFKTPRCWQVFRDKALIAVAFANLTTRVVTEQELNDYVVMRTIHESTFS